MTTIMKEWRTGDPPLRDDDGMLLLFTEEVAERAGVQVTTVRWSIAASRRARREGRPTDFPPVRRYVRRTTIKANRRPVTVTTPVFREDKIDYWVTHRLGPGGKQRSELEEPQLPGYQTAPLTARQRGTA